MGRVNLYSPVRYSCLLWIRERNVCQSHWKCHPSQLARMWRQASLQNKPDIDAGLEFTKWAKDKLWFYDQHGTITPKALLSVMRYAKDNLDIDIVLIDSLMTMSLNSDDWNGQKQVVQSIANTARHLGIHIILVAHARKGGSVKDKLDKWSGR